MEKSIVILIVIVVLIILILCFVGSSVISSSSTDDNPDDPVDPVDPVDPADCTYPTITNATGTYDDSSSYIQVTGTNFKNTSTWSYGSKNGIVSYINSTNCEIYINSAISSGYLKISNSTCSSSKYYLQLSKVPDDPDEPPVIDDTPKLSLDSTSYALVGSTTNYDYFVFNVVVSNARINVNKDITKDDDFGIICVGGGGGGGGNEGGDSSCGGGGGGCSVLLNKVLASKDHYFTINVGAGGAAGPPYSGAGGYGANSSVSYYDPFSVPFGQLIARGGEGGTKHGAGFGGEFNNDDNTLENDTESTADGGMGGDKVDGENAIYDNDPESVDYQFTGIPPELVGINGISICYGGGGGGGRGGSDTVFSGGEGGKGGGISTDTGGLRGIENASSNYAGFPGTHYGGGGGAAGFKNFVELYGGGAGKNGIVVFFIKK